MVEMQEKRKMLKERKEAKQRFDYQTGGVGAGPLTLQEIQNQTQMVFNYHYLMMERQRLEEEKRRLEDQRKYQDLQNSIERLQRQLLHISVGLWQIL